MRKKVRRIFLSCFGIIIVLGLAIFFIGRSYYDTEINKAGNNSAPVKFVIQSGASLQSIAVNLQSTNIITNEPVFLFYTRIHHLDTSIEAGTYLIPKHISIVSLISLLHQSNFYLNVTIPGGLRLEQQAALIDQQLSKNNSYMQFTELSYINLAKDPVNFSYPFITSQTTTLEGFLFPDTYQVTKDITAEEMINKMLTNFNTKVYTQYTTQSIHGLSFYQVLTLASIIEREAPTPYDQKMIADILERRLQNDMPLQVDSTIQYMLGYSETEKTWWRQTIYEKDLQTDTPYNLYLHAGLTPSPISNPPLQAIVDVLNPIQNTYNFYLSDSNGNLHFATTSAEQEANILKYLPGR